MEELFIELYRRRYVGQIWVVCFGRNKKLETQMSWVNGTIRTMECQYAKQRILNYG